MIALPPRGVPQRIYPSAIVLVGADRLAVAGMQVLLQGRWPGIPVSCPPPREVLIQARAVPGSLLVPVLCTHPSVLLPQLRQLLWLRRRTRNYPWLLLYDGEHEALPVLLPGVQMLSLGTPVPRLLQTLDRVMQNGWVAPSPTRLWPLTWRQWEVLRLLSLGHRPRTVGRLLGIAEKTVSSHRTALLLRLGLSRHHEWLLFSAVVAMLGPDGRRSLGERVRLTEIPVKGRPVTGSRRVDETGVPDTRPDHHGHAA